MAWVIDTCLLIDVAEEDPAFGAGSAALIDTHRPAGLMVCPVSYVELAPVFEGHPEAQDEFLYHLGVTWPEAWMVADTVAAHKAWYHHVTARRAGQVRKRPVADVLIGAFASRFDGLLTRNQSDFARLFPGLRTVGP
ncbi:MAG: type II toxin-antitoxin system VapC family toxin [Verrucomicrobiales bacterium]|nr:type II toxin-antitoxin system VapC family toxin [Verrucomicrobiales bacterium]